MHDFLLMVQALWASPLVQLGVVGGAGALAVTAVAERRAAQAPQTGEGS